MCVCDLLLITWTIYLMILVDRTGGFGAGLEVVSPDFSISVSLKES